MKRNNNAVDKKEFLASIEILSKEIQQTKTILADKKLELIYEQSKEVIDNKRKLKSA